MYRIDNSTAATTLVAPTPPGPQPDGFFTGGTPTTGGGSPTRVDAEWLNMMQEELVNVIVAAGLTLDKGNRTQLLQALRILGRVRLAADLNLYVSTTGSDSNNGSAGAPFLTLQAAWNAIVENYDLNGHNVTVNVANGTYTQGMTCGASVQGLGSGNSILFLGNPSTPASCVLSVTSQPNAIVVANGNTVKFSGLTITTSGVISGVPINGLVATSGGSAQIVGNMAFGPCAGPHMDAYFNGNISILASYTIVGGAVAHVRAQGGAIVCLQGSPATVTLTGTPAFSFAFADANSGGSIQLYSSVYTTSGAATGKRYDAALNGTMNTGGAGANFFPGSVAGTTETGGQYA